MDSFFSFLFKKNPPNLKLELNPLCCGLNVAAATGSFLLYICLDYTPVLDFEIVFLSLTKENLFEVTLS